MHAIASSYHPTARFCSGGHVKLLTDPLPAACTTVSLTSNSSLNPDQITSITEALRNHRNLDALYMSFNSIGSHGAVQIAGAVKVNPVLTCLKMGHNQIGLAGINAIALAARGQVYVCFPCC